MEHNGLMWSSRTKLRLKLSYLYMEQNVPVPSTSPEIYQVGGCVRDKLLGLESKDIDFTYVSSDLTKTVEEGFAEMTKWMEDNEYKVFLSTPSMFTIRAKFPETHPTYKGWVADFVMARKKLGIRRTAVIHNWYLATIWMTWFVGTLQ